MKTWLTAVFVASLTLSTVGQQKKLEHLPISDYMCHVGLLYIENIEDYEQACKRETGWCESADARWTKYLVESRTESTLAYADQVVRQAIPNSSNCFR